MLPFIPRRWFGIGTVVVASLTIVGCTGQNLAGSWRGALPWRNGEDCRIRMVPEGRFDVSCRDRVSGRTDAWVGTGSYTSVNGQLKFQFAALAERGVAQRAPLPELSVTLDGHGNSMTIRQPNFESRWHRLWR